MKQKLFSILLLLIYCTNTNAQIKCESGDCKNGFGKMKNRNQKFTYEGTFKDGKKHGLGTIRFDSLISFNNGNINSIKEFTGSFANDKMVGGEITMIGVFTTANISELKKFKGKICNGNLLDGECLVTFRGAYEIYTYDKGKLLNEKAATAEDIMKFNAMAFSLEPQENEDNSFANSTKLNENENNSITDSTNKSVKVSSNLDENTQSFQNEGGFKPFITVWKTDIGEGPSNSIGFHIFNFDEDKVYYAEWESQSDPNIKGSQYLSRKNYEIIFPSEGIYILKLFPANKAGTMCMYFDDYSRNEFNAYPKKLLEIMQWGTATFDGSLSFYSCENMDMTATDLPKFGKNISLSNLFYGCKSLVANPSISNWDMTNVTSLKLLFGNCHKFNQPLNNWDVSNVYGMYSTFYGASIFNQPLNNWNVTSVEDMGFMFGEATDFNQPLDKWDVSNVKEMGQIFKNAKAFNQDLSSWVLRGLMHKWHMFEGATAYTGINYENVPTNVPPVNGSSSKKVVINKNFDTKKLLTVAEVNAIKKKEGVTAAIKPLITVWDSKNPGVSSSYEIWYPTKSTNRPSLIEWYDKSNPTITGIIFSFDEENTKIEFPKSGIYVIKAYYWWINDFVMLPVGSMNVKTDPQKLLEITQWGSAFVGSYRFKDCINLDITATDTPTLYKTTSLLGMFENCTSLVGNTSFNKWNTSSINNMEHVFNNCKKFNQPIGNWNTSKVRWMTSMFYNAENFNQAIGNWNTSSLEKMTWMFKNAKLFNQDLSKWNLTKIEYGIDVFDGATAYKGIDYSKSHTEPTVTKTATSTSENNTQPSFVNEMNCKMTISDYESKVSLALTNFQAAFAQENNWASCIMHLETALENMEKIESAYIGCKGRSMEINDKMRANMANLKKGVVDDIKQMKEDYNYEPFRKMVWEMTPKLKQFFDDNTFSNL